MKATTGKTATHSDMDIRGQVSLGDGSDFSYAI